MIHFDLKHTFVVLHLKILKNNLKPLPNDLISDHYRYPKENYAGKHQNSYKLSSNNFQNFSSQKFYMKGVEVCIGKKLHNQ